MFALTKAAAALPLVLFATLALACAPDVEEERELAPSPLDAATGEVISAEAGADAAPLAPQPDAGSTGSSFDAGSTPPATVPDAGSSSSDAAVAETGTGGPVPSPQPASCASNTLKPGNSTVTLTHDGARREFLLHVPPSYGGSEAVPLVLDIHGLTSSASAQAALSGWRAKSDAEGFIVVHPNGLGASWNGGALCCGSSQSSGVDDEGFMRAIVEKLAIEGCIDRKRVYATGLSNGGAMSHLLACRAADVFAATAPVSMGNGARPCAPARPISVVMFRGTSDALVPYNGGLFPSARADFDQWKALDGCTGAATKRGVCETFSGCAGGTEVTLCTIDAGHVLYSQAAQQGANIPDTVWEVFKRQALP